MEILFELMWEVAVEVLLAAAFSAFDSRVPNEPGTRVLRLISAFILGAVLGAVSTWVWPTPRLSSPLLRVAWLVVAPVIGGVTMSLVKAALSGGPPWLRPWSIASGAALVGTVAVWRFIALG